VAVLEQRLRGRPSEAVGGAGDEDACHALAECVSRSGKGEKRFNHPIVGELELSYNRIELPADPGLMIVAYTVEPGSRSQESMSLLASWAATEEVQETVSGHA
jgi:MmyB-like transcription regulator ligand binding domain